MDDPLIFFVYIFAGMSQLYVYISYAECPNIDEYDHYS